jgi:glycosyltransferase involved in cell wall biosynthesis
MHIVHTESSQGWGGQEIRILSEAAGMIARGHRVTLLTPPTARIHDVARNRGIETVALPLEKKRLPGLLALRRWLTENPSVDVINTHSSTDSWLTGLAVLLSGQSPAIVRTRHISAPVHDSFSNRWLYGSSARRVVTTGEALRLDLINGLKLPAEHVLSVATGIDLQRFSRSNAPQRIQARRALGLPEAAFIIGIAATLRSWKGHDDLLAAFELLAAEHPLLHVAIAGDGPRREHLEQKICASAHAERIHLLGHHEDVPAVLAALDLFVLPSYANEGVPQAVMQAMAMELPVISTTIGAISDAVVDGTTGRLLNPRDPQALAAAITSLKNDNMLRQNYALAGRRRAEEKFSLNGMVDAMLDVFQLAHASTRR